MPKKRNSGKSDEHNKNTDRKLPSTAWKPGQSGNPKGRPSKEKIYPPVIREILDAKTFDISIKINGEEKKLNIKSSKPLIYATVLSMIDQAIKGNVNAFRELVNRVDGRAIQHIIEHEMYEEKQIFNIGGKEIVF